MVNAAESNVRRYRFDDVIVDRGRFHVEKGGQTKTLTPRAFDLLAYLLEHRDRVVEKQELFERVWKGEFVTDNALTRAIKEIRQAIGDEADSPRYIETVHKRGYRFIAPVEGLAPLAPAIKPAEPPGTRLGGIVRIGGLGLAAALVLLAVLIGLNVGGWRERIFGGGSKPIRSLAVLPLENLSGDPEQEYFADGMTEALITELGKISALRVISRQSVMRYKDTDKPVPEIARELNVDAVVEGAVRREGSRVLISAQLVQAHPETHLWAESYERDLSDVLALQGEVAQAIAREIKVAVTPAEETRLAATRSVNPEAYEAYLKAVYFDWQATAPSIPKAVDYVLQAIQKAPNYAPSHALLAHCYLVHGSSVLGLSPKEAYAKGKEAVEKAVALDNTLPAAHRELAYAAYLYDWAWAKADRAFKKAIELNPGSALTQTFYAEFLSSMGRHTEAIAAAQRSRELDPLNADVTAQLGYAFHYARQQDRAIGLFQNALEIQPKHWRLYTGLGRAYLAKGMYEEAIEAFETGKTLAGRGLPLLAHAYALGGRRAEAVKHLNEYLELSRQQYVRSLNMARIYVALGEKDKAMEWLEKGYKTHETYMAKLKRDQTFDLLRSDPRFQDLLRRMNFPPQ